MLVGVVTVVTDGKTISVPDVVGTADDIVIAPDCRRCSASARCPASSVLVDKRTRGPGEGPTSKSKRKGCEAERFKNVITTSMRGTMMTINPVHHAIRLL